MVQQMAPFSAAKTLLNNDLFSFNSRAFPALFGFGKFQTHNLLNRMEEIRASQVDRLRQRNYSAGGERPDAP